MGATEVNVRMLLAVAVVIAGSRALGWGLARLGQPRVHGEIVAGILLGPSLLGQVWPGAVDYVFPPEVVDALRILAQLGLVIFMFLIGLELDLGKLHGHGRTALVVSNASIAVPLVLGALLALWLYARLGQNTDPLGFVLFVGAAMAITAFPVLARVLQETGLYHTRIGVLTIACAAVDVVAAWCILAVAAAIVRSGGAADALQTIALSLVFVVAMLRIVRPLLALFPAIPIWGALVLALGCAWITEQIGIHVIFGAFLAGTVMPRRDDALAGIHDRSEIHEKLETATLTLLLPVFFVVVGLETRVDLLDQAYLWAVAALVLAVAVAGKWGGAMLAARAVGESWRDAATMGVLLNTRGLTELIVLSVGLELGVLSPTLFTILVLMALVTTLMATPTLAFLGLAGLGQEIDDSRGEGRVHQRRHLARHR
ncbi:MAG TPA: cation:proton antiporter [Acidimicrobiales bacterium]